MRLMVGAGIKKGAEAPVPLLFLRLERNVAAVSWLGLCVA